MRPASSRTRRSRRCRPATTRCRSCSREMRVTKAGTGQMLWLDLEVLEGPLPGPARLRPAEPDQPEPDRRGDRAAHAQRHLPRGRQAPGLGQRGAALPADGGEGRRPAQRLQRGQGLQAGPAGDHRLPRPRDRLPHRWPTSAQRQPPRRQRPGRGALDPEEGSAVADRVWRHGGDGALPTMHSENVHGGQDASPGARLPARPCRRPGQRAAPRSTSCAATSTPSRRRSPPPISSGRQGAARWIRAGTTGPRTAIRHKRQQIAALTAHLQSLPSGGRKARVQGLPDRGPA